MEGRVTGVAEDQRFPTTGDHNLRPIGQRAAPFLSEIGELPYVMDLDLLSGVTDFARIRQEPFEQLCPSPVVIWDLPLSPCAAGIRMRTWRGTLGLPVPVIQRIGHGGGEVL
jgi:hypothetical protein